MAKRIDTESELLNSFKPYKYHVLTATNQISKDWHTDGPPQIKYQDSESYRVMNTFYTDERGTGDMLFPQGIYFDSTQDQDLANAKPLSKIPYSHIIMVCSHMKRDKKCGVIGPLLIEQFKTELEKSNLTDNSLVIPVSHVGGHKFAGNIIIYRKKHGSDQFFADWYGRVKTCHVEAIVRDCIKQDLVLKDLFRGRMLDEV